MKKKKRKQIRSKNHFSNNCDQSVIIIARPFRCRLMNFTDNNKKIACDTLLSREKLINNFFFLPFILFAIWFVIHQFYSALRLYYLLCCRSLWCHRRHLSVLSNEERHIHVARSRYTQSQRAFSIKKHVVSDTRQANWLFSK